VGCWPSSSSNTVLCPLGGHFDTFLIPAVQRNIGYAYPTSERVPVHRRLRGWILVEQAVCRRNMTGVRVAGFARRWSWSLLGLLLCTLVFAVLPGGQVRLGARQLQGLVGSYLYANPMRLPEPSDVRITQIFLPKTIRVEWNDGGENIFPDSSFVVQRIDPATSTVLATFNTHDEFWVDSFDFQYGTTYEYRVTTVPTSSAGSELPPPPPGADPNEVTYYWVASDPVSIQAVPQYHVADENQTVDSRLDLRYGNPTLLDFKFGSRIYKGGLYAGFASDPSRVGRSFLKFELPSLPTGASYWAGSVNAYHTVSAAGGNTEIGCQEVADASWTAAPLKWSLAPTLAPGDAVERYTVVYDPDTPANSTTWAHWSLNSEIEGAFAGTGLLSVGLASTHETWNKWVYFAKKEYDSSLSPVVLYAYEPAP